MSVDKVQEMYDLQAKVEEALEDARGIFSIIDYEVAPEIADPETRKELREHCRIGMNRVDDAINATSDSGGKYEDLHFKYQEERDECARLESQVAQIGFATVATDLLCELDGRLLTDTRESAMAWLQAALLRLSEDGTTDDYDHAQTAITDAIRMAVAV